MGWALWGPLEAPVLAGNGRQMVRKAATGSGLVAWMCSLAPFNDNRTIYSDLWPKVRH